MEITNQPGQTPYTMTKKLTSTKVIGQKRKSKAEQNTITLEDGSTFKILTDPLPDVIPRQLVEGLVTRIKELTAPKKRAKKTATKTAAVASSSSSSSSSSSNSSSSLAPVSKTILNGHKKQIVQSIKANLKSLKFFTSYDAIDRKVKVDQFVPENVFQSMFGSEGTLLQPLPTNKPKSKVIIRRIQGGSVLSILGEPTLKGTEWIKGGAPSRGYGGFGGGFFGGRGGGGFSKGKKLKQVELVYSGEIYIEVKYATTSQKMTFALSFNTANARAFADRYTDRYNDY